MCKSSRKDRLETFNSAGGCLCYSLSVISTFMCCCGLCMTTYIFYPSVLCEAKILKFVRCHQVAAKWLEAIFGLRRSKSR